MQNCRLSLLCFAVAVPLVCGPASAQEFSWRRVLMDESRTGTRMASAQDVEESLGSVKGRKYLAPNGRSYRGGAVREVAGIMLDAQPAMSHVKVVVGHSPRRMEAHAPESALSNWVADTYMNAVSELTGKKVDVSFANFGGIRTSMPEGNVLADDIMSMFPFKNKLCYLELKGADLRRIYEGFAAGRVQCIGGARLVIRDRKIESVTIGGEPLDDERTYGVATIDFLLDGGDNLSLARNALKLEILDEYVIDYMLPYVRRLTAEGKEIEYHEDGRVQVIGGVRPPARPE